MRKYYSIVYSLMALTFLLLVGTIGILLFTRAFPIMSCIKPLWLPCTTP